ncbi:hypothetical protein GWN26_02340 [Candidatus Saccharibacteria bacterium]|nr:hypothetical protein [Candidatus Saccharibacteria bacterium]NIV71486.1 hypothetical protein [Calditrichia bacterium]NIV98040.1 hypothetical protein [Candidatus Saccharibacteria bacterium]NIW78338.1 hypothetical protein [Calditrichia bacterium]
MLLATVLFKKLMVRKHLTTFVLAFLSIFFLNLWGCGNGADPPDEIIEEAKRHTVDIIENVQQERMKVEEGPLELVDEYYNQKNQRYVLTYRIEIRFGSALTKTPTAYIMKDGQGWRYKLSFDQEYEFSLPKNQ